jgi:hypothetical protein
MNHSSYGNWGNIGDDLLDFFSGGEYKKTQADLERARRDERRAEERMREAEKAEAKAQADSLVRQDLADKRLEAEKGVKYYTDQERASLGLTGENLDIIHDAERRLLEQELQLTIAQNLEDAGLTDTGMEWGKIALGAILLGGVGFGAYKVSTRQGSKSGDKKRSRDRSRQKQQQRTI